METNFRPHFSLYASILKDIFPTFDPIGKLISKNLGIPLVTNVYDEDTYVTVWYLYSIGFCHMKGLSVKEMTFPITIAEAIGIPIPEDDYLNQNHSLVQFIEATLHFIVEENYSNEYNVWKKFNPANTEHSDITIQNVVRRFPRKRFSLSLDRLVNMLRTVNGECAVYDIGPDVVNWKHLTVEELTILARGIVEALLAMIGTASGGIRLKKTHLLTVLYVAILNRGTITDVKLRRISREMKKSTGRITEITAKAFSNIYRCLGKYFNPTSAQQIFNTWLTDVKESSEISAILTREIIQGGMTSYWTIRRALQLHEGFYWNAAANILNEDFRNFAEAVECVGNDEWYGFNKDLGPARRNKFKSLMWLSVKLLVKNNSAEFGALRHYEGLVTQPNYQSFLEALIEAYDPHVTVSIPGSRTNEYYERIRKAIIQADAVRRVERLSITEGLTSFELAAFVRQRLKKMNGTKDNEPI